MKHFLTYSLSIVLIIYYNDCIGQVNPLSQTILDEFGLRFYTRFQYNDQFRGFYVELIRQKNKNLTFEEIDNIVEQIPSSKRSQQIIFQIIYDYGKSSEGIYAILKSLDLSASKASAIKEYIQRTCSPNNAKVTYDNKPKQIEKIVKSQNKEPQVKASSNEKENIVLILKDNTEILLSSFPDESYRNHPKEWRTNLFSSLNGVKVLLAEFFSGGANCCEVYYLFQQVSENKYIYVRDFGENGNSIEFSDNKLVVNYAAQLNYFMSCRACNINDILPYPVVINNIYLQLKANKLFIINVSDKDLNLKLNKNLEYLSKREVPKLDGSQDDGTRKSYAINIMAYFFNNERNLNATQVLFNKYYKGDDKEDVWSMILDEIQSLVQNYSS